MRKDTIAYKIKKRTGILVIRMFEWVIRVVDGNKDFYDLKDFSFVKMLEENTGKIRDEYLQLASSAIIPKIEEVFIEQEILTGDDNWRSYLLTIYGYDLIEHLERCPVTTDCINRIPLMTSALFSVLQPGKKIRPHRGIYNGILRCHLALIVPDVMKCEIIVNGKTEHWKEGKCMIFDETFIHSVNNRSDRPRVILFLDFIRPLPAPFNYINLFFFHLIARSEFIREILDRSEKLDGVKYRERAIKLP